MPITSLTYQGKSVFFMSRFPFLGPLLIKRPVASSQLATGRRIFRLENRQTRLKVCDAFRGCRLLTVNDAIIFVNMVYRAKRFLHLLHFERNVDEFEKRRCHPSPAAYIRELC